MVRASQQDKNLDPLVITAGQDLARGLLKWHISSRLGWLEIRRRYRRTIIGPFWNSINLGILVAALGGIGVGLWKQNVATYVPFLTAGLITWILISTMVSESCLLFVGSQNLFRQLRLNYSILAYSLVWRNFIAFLHNLLVYAAAILIFAPSLVRPVILLVLPGLLLVLLNGVWMALLLGMACLRYRDLQQLIGNLVQIAIFITPIFWPPELLEGAYRAVFVSLNPLYHMIQIVRAPMVGTVPDVLNYLVVAGVTAVGWMVTYWTFAKFRKRIAYWS
jgi:ABC-type polysaccharide/polyol phosphate export permease